MSIRAVEGGLAVWAETARCEIRSITAEDLGDCQRLYGDAAVMRLFGDGARSPERVAKNVATWVKRWQRGDPYSAMVVREKATGTMVGVVVIGHGCEEGEADAAGLGFEEFQRQELGTEVLCDFVVSRYLEELKGYPANRGDEEKEGRLKYLHATARVGNEVSWRLLERAGFRREGAPIRDEKTGVERYNYYLEV